MIEHQQYPCLTALPLDLAVLRAADVYPESSSHVGCRFEVSPAAYLQFGEKDLEDGSLRGHLNAVHNAKRAITCAVDGVLTNFGLADSCRRPFPHKLELVRSVGLVSPRIVRKLVAMRNVLEHQYARVTASEAEDAVDIATLFTSVLQPFVATHYSGFDVNEFSECVEGMLNWAYYDEGRKRWVIGGEVDQSQPPRGIALEFYAALNREQDWTPSGLNQLHRVESRLSQRELQERGVRELGYGIVAASEAEPYLELLRAIVRGIRSMWTWSPREECDDEPDSNRRQPR